jgi:hypothetical protein
MLDEAISAAPPRFGQNWLPDRAVAKAMLHPYNSEVQMDKWFLFDKVRVAIHAVEKTRRVTMLGCGMYRVPDPAAGPLKARTVRVHDLSYADAQLRSVGCIGGTWVPYDVRAKEDYDKTSSMGCGGGCSQMSDCDFVSDCWWCDPFDGCTP